MYYHQYQEENNMPKALGYSAAVMAVLALIGFFIVFGQPQLPEYGMGGIIVNYGTSEEGMGDDYMSIEEPSMDENANEALPDRINPTTTPQETPTQQVSDNVVATQDMEEAPAVTKTEKPVANPATTTTKEEKKAAPTVNEKALFRSSKSNNGTGRGDGTGSTPGNQGSALGDPLASNYGEGGSGFGNEPISLSSRAWAVRPNIQDDGQFSGVVVSEVTIDKNGNVINVRSGVKGTTYSSSSVNEMLNRELRKGKFNAIPNAPDRRTVLIKIEFKLR